MAVTVALFIATIKGSLVACYFMHLISEKKLIYVASVTAFMFLALLALPCSRTTTASDPVMNLRLFHATLILLSAAPDVRSLVAGLYGRARGRKRADGLAAFAVALGLIAYDSWFLRKTRSLR